MTPEDSEALRARLRAEGYEQTFDGPRETWIGDALDRRTSVVYFSEEFGVTCIGTASVETAHPTTLAEAEEWLALMRRS